MNQTHYYDGKWSYIPPRQLDLTFEEAIEEISRIRPDLQKVSNLLLKDRDNNYDKINKVHVEDLLPDVWMRWRDREDKSLFFEQYGDIIRGPCSQGRTTRLFQLLQID